MSIIFMIPFLAIVACVSNSESRKTSAYSVAVFQTINPWNSTAVMKEWRKIEKRINDNGILLSDFSSLSAVFYAPAHQADSARSIIKCMIENGEIDVKKLQLQVITAELGSSRKRRLKPALSRE